jgi:hypothetical protein
MVALAQDRNTPARSGDLREGAVGAAQLVYAGAIVMRNATGFLIKGATATGSVAVGRADERIDNAAGANGDKRLRYRAGIFRFANASAGDLLTIADVGKCCWVIDDQTVGRTSATTTRSRAGIVESVDADGVWVRFDEALARVATPTAA